MPRIIEPAPGGRVASTIEKVPWAGGMSNLSLLRVAGRGPFAPRKTRNLGALSDNCATWPHSVSPNGAIAAGSFPLERLLFVELHVALISAGVDLAPVEGLLDGAAGLVGMGAVREPAIGDVGAELHEMGLELARDDAPELELAEPGGVDHVAPQIEADQLRVRRGVLALGGPVGDLAHLEVQPRLDRVQERALADAALPRHGRDPLGQEVAQAIEPAAVGGRGHHGLVAELRVEAD